MSEALVNLISEGRRLKTSFVPRLSDEDVASVWALVSEFIEKQMLQRKGVSIQNLGIFSFATKTVDIGNNRSIVLQRPVFLLSEKFAQTHCIRYAKQYIPGQIPVVALNYTVVANYSPYDRDTVEMCVKEVLHTLSYVVGMGKSVELPFVSIGKLVVRDGRAKMKFFRDFIHQLDSSGQLEDAFLHQRSATAMSTISMQSEASIISNRAGSVLSRPGTTGSVVLPRIVEPSSQNSLNLICNSPNSGGALLPTSPKMPPISEEETGSREDSQWHSTSKAPTTAESVAGGLQSPSMLKPTPFPLVRGQQLETQEEQGKKVQCSGSDQGEESGDFRRQPSTCFHPMSRGQELCYICHQRAMANIPVSFTEERRQREKLEDQVLQEYLQKKESLEMAKDQMQNMQHREESKKVAAFNLCVAGVKHSKKVARSNEFQPSYVFQERPVTPPKQTKQTQYCQQLDKQVHQRKTHHETVKRAEEEKDRQEKILIARELQADHKEFVKNQLRRKKEYQEALAEQVRFKPPSLPACEPDSVQPIFGVHDAAQEKREEQRRIAKQLFQDQLEMVRQKQQLSSLKAEKNKNEEAHMLKKAKQDLLGEYQQKLSARDEIRRSLDEAWKQSLLKKKERELADVRHDEAPSILLHQQCERYKRCKQCQRRTSNVGGSNVLAESRYISGARLMV